VLEPQAELRIPNLTKLDQHELEQYLGEAATFETEQLTSEKTGEPVTIAAVMILSALAIKGISLWLMKQRTKSGATLAVEKKLPDGTVISQSIKFTFSSSSPPAAEVIQKVGQALGAEDNLIEEALKG
jgi:cytochrome c553